MPSHVELTGDIPLDGSHRYYDRDEVHEIYADWRRLFNEYDPPRIAVAEAWVPTERRRRYASPEGLGQAFNFDLLTAPWDAGEFRRVIEKNLGEVEGTGSSLTWVFSNHDVVRHATRYGLPQDCDLHDWLMSDGADPVENVECGLRRARAATMLALALPGSTYLYQGEELGLREVATIPANQLQDPTWERTGHHRKGRDGCRVPLPWAPIGSSFGFGADGAHLPQPAWFADYSVDTQHLDSSSTLNLYRRALRLRRTLLTSAGVTWVGDRTANVVEFQRGDSWTSITNFGTEPVPLPEGAVVLTSQPPANGELPGETTAWLRRS